MPSSLASPSCINFAAASGAAPTNHIASLFAGSGRRKYPNASRSWKRRTTASASPKRTSKYAVPANSSDRSKAACRGSVSATSRAIRRSCKKRNSSPLRSSLRPKEPTDDGGLVPVGKKGLGKPVTMRKSPPRKGQPAKQARAFTHRETTKFKYETDRVTDTRCLFGARWVQARRYDGCRVHHHPVDQRCS